MYWVVTANVMEFTSKMLLLFYLRIFVKKIHIFFEAVREHLPPFQVSLSDIVDTLKEITVTGTTQDCFYKFLNKFGDCSW